MHARYLTHEEKCTVHQLHKFMVVMIDLDIRDHQGREGAVANHKGASARKTEQR
jgi:hypothetical protein